MVVHVGNSLMSRTIGVSLVINVHLISVIYHVTLVLVEQPLHDFSTTLMLEDVKDLFMVVAVVMTITLELSENVRDSVVAVSIY